MDGGNVANWAPEWGAGSMAGLEDWCGGTQDSHGKRVGAWTIPGFLYPSSSQTSPLQEASSVTSPNSMDCGGRQAWASVPPLLAVWPRVNDFISVLEFSALHGSWWYPPQRVLTRSIKLILAVTNIYLAGQNTKGFTCLLKELMRSTRTTLSRSFPHIPISQIRKFRHREVE